MSAEVAYRQPFVNNSGMSSPYGSDRSALLSGLRTSPRSQQQFVDTNLFQQQQQQMQLAMYYQQQMELSQQQQQLEMQLRLEQMRLQNLALQEQIMMGQQAQAQAQAEAELQQRRGVYQAPQKSAVGARFAVAQGGVLAERAMARRQAQAEAEESDAVTALNTRSPVRNNSIPSAYQTPTHTHHRRASSTNSILSSSTSPHDPNAATPALVLSKPGEVFPVPSQAESPTAFVSHQHTDSGSSASTRSSLSSFLHHSRDTSDAETLDSPPSDSISFGGKASPPMAAEDRKWRAVRDSDSPKLNNGSPKLNPFSNVFVPSSTAMTQTASEPVPVVAPVPTASAGVYRARGAGSPTLRGSPVARSTVVMGAVPIRQPKGPPSHVEDLDKVNFQIRIRQRAIGAIRALGVRVPASPDMQQSFEFQQTLPAGAVSPGLAALMAATRIREERLRGEM